MPIHLEFDKHKNKFFYQFGQTGKRYYFNSLSGETKAYKNVLSQARAIEYSKHSGGNLNNQDIIIGNSIPDLLPKLPDVFPVRTNFPPSVRNIIANYGEKNIIDISVGRNPIKKSLTKLINILSIGKLKKAMNDMGYDKLFHLFMLVTLDDDTMLLVEKNEVINIKIVPRNFNVSEEKIVHLNQSIKFNTFINTAADKVGPTFYTYDAQNNNCQIFVRNILQYNNLLTPELNNFIMQDITTLLSKTPKWTSKIARLTTDFASRIDRLRHGQPVAAGLYSKELENLFNPLSSY